MFMKKIKLKFMSLTRLDGLKDRGVRLRPFSFVVPVLLLVASIACNKESGPSIIEATSVSLNKTSVSLAVGESVELTATVFPEDATDKTVSWSSSNTSVVTVSDGRVKAVGIGSATVIAQSGSVRTECSVTVSAVEVTSVKLNKTSVSLAVGGLVVLTATVSPENATDKTVTWSSSDESVATVKDGKVESVGAGTVTITARAGDVKAECAVTVEPVEVTSIQLDQESVVVPAGGTVELTATISPENATDKTVTWSSSDESVATVIDGKVTGVGVGSATITAQAGDFKAECSVTVIIEVVSIQLDRTSATLSVGNDMELTATVLPEDATDKTVVWASSDESVAIVIDGKVTAVSVGSATITAQAGNIKVVCSVTVIIEVASIKLNKASVILYPGDSMELTATVLPENATDKTVTWSSSNASVATVANGKVTVVGVGSAAITARTSNGRSVECVIVVKDKGDEDVPPGGSEGTGEIEW